MIGTRLMMKGTDRGWTNPYVTDGIVAQYDGEWNAGGGVHDASATVWKALVGGVDVPLSTSGAWTDSSLTRINSTVMQGAAYTGNSKKFTLTTDQTFEVVFRLGSGSGNRAVIAAFLTQESIAAQMSGSTFMPCGNGKTHFAKSISNNTKYSISSTVNPQYSVLAMYANGEVVASTASNSISYGSAYFSFLGGRATSSIAYGDLYSVRLYSRALTAAEIAANYAVDKARFNLPS